MVAAELGVDRGGAAELAHDEDHRGLEQAPLVQVFEQHRQGPVQDRGQVASDTWYCRDRDRSTVRRTIILS